MKIAIVDNSTKHLDKLLRILKNYEVRVMKHDCIDEKVIDHTDALILTGGSIKPAMSTSDIYKMHFSLIKTYDKPILGICLGLQLMARAYGMKIVRNQTRIEGIRSIKIIKQDPIFNQIKNNLVYEGHWWSVVEGNNLFDILAISDAGFEVIKHKEKPHYGVQFHPEVMTSVTCGQQVLTNFISLVENYNKL